MANVTLSNTNTSAKPSLDSNTRMSSARDRRKAFVVGVGTLYALQMECKDIGQVYDIQQCIIGMTKFDKPGKQNKKDYPDYGLGMSFRPLSSILSHCRATLCASDNHRSTC